MAQDFADNAVTESPFVFLAAMAHHRQGNTGRAFALLEDHSEELAGEINLRLVLAINDGETLFDVCDADSALLEAVYAVLFDELEETKGELDVEPGWSNLLFIDEIKLEPAYRETSLAMRLIQTAIATFASDGLVVTVEKAIDLDAREWRKLGFRRIAGLPFVYADQLRVNRYEMPDGE